MDRLRAHPAHGVEHGDSDRVGRGPVSGPLLDTVVGAGSDSSSPAFCSPWGQWRRTGFTLHGDPFVASRAQLACAAIVCGCLIAMAFTLRGQTGTARAPGKIPSAWVVGSLSLGAGSLFLLVPNTWGWGAVAAYVALDLALITAVAQWSNRAGWDGRHRLALARRRDVGLRLARVSPRRRWSAGPVRPPISSAMSCSRLEP